MYSSAQQSHLSKSLPPTPSQLHPSIHADEDVVPDDYFVESDEVPLPFPIQTIVADPPTGLSLTLVSALGAGSYAVVYLAQEVSSDKLYALKCLGKSKLTPDEVAIQRNEVIIHTSLPKHRNIIHLFNMFETTQHLFLLLEYSSGMDMYQWISIRSDQSDPETGAPHTPAARFTVIKDLFDQVLEGVGEVHRCGVAHRDLKPENFLVERSDGLWTVKLTDFGLATTDMESDEFECGSKPYMSYECRNGQDTPYNVHQADVWSLGIIIINLLYHRCPWSDPCPDESYAFSSFLKNKVDFLQRRFEDMSGPVARWLGLRAFAFVGPGNRSSKRSRPTVAEWKHWMQGFVPRMLGQADPTDEDAFIGQTSDAYSDEADGMYNDRDEYYGEEEEEESEESDEDEDDAQVVPIEIRTSLLKPDLIRESRPQPSFSSSAPKFDPSSFYQPTRLRQESWSDAIDMEGTEDAAMDFSAPILFEESDEDGIGTGDIDDEGDSSGLAVALPDDFIDPEPELSSSVSRLTPDPALSQLTFNSEKRYRPSNVQLDHEEHKVPIMQDRTTSRGSPIPDAQDQINTLVFIEPDPSRVHHDSSQNTSSNSISLASSLPNSSHLTNSLGHGVDLSTEQHPPHIPAVKRPIRNLQEVKAAPFVFPPLKTSHSTNLSLDYSHNLLQQQQLQQQQLQKQQQQQQQQSKSMRSSLEFRSRRQEDEQPASKWAMDRSSGNTFKRSPLGAAGNSGSIGQNSLRPIQDPVFGHSGSSFGNSSGGRSSGWRKSHHRGGSWTSIDDVWDGHRDMAKRVFPDGSRLGSGHGGGGGGGGGGGRRRIYMEDKEETQVGLPPRAENKFRPRYRPPRRYTPTTSTAALPPVPPLSAMQAFSSGGSRSRNQSRSGHVYDYATGLSNANTSANANGKENTNAASTASDSTRLPSSSSLTKDFGRKEDLPKDLSGLTMSMASKGPPSQSRLNGKPNGVGSTSTSRLASQRNRSLVDLRGIDPTNLPWRQLDLTGSTAAADSKGSGHARENSLDKEGRDNIYHPPQWYERRSSQAAAAMGGSLRRLPNGLDAEFYSNLKGDGPTGGIPSSRSGTKGRHQGSHSVSSGFSSLAERNKVYSSPADTAISWRGIGSGVGGHGDQILTAADENANDLRSKHDSGISNIGSGGPGQEMDLKPSLPSTAITTSATATTAVTAATTLTPSVTTTATTLTLGGALGPATLSSVSTLNGSGGPPVMTLTPPTPSVAVKTEFMVESPSHDRSMPPTVQRSMKTAMEESNEAKKIVRPGAMAGLGNLLRGLVDYNKGVKVGGEGIMQQLPQENETSYYSNTGGGMDNSNSGGGRGEGEGGSSKGVQ